MRAHRNGGGRDDWRPFCLFGGFALAYLVFLTATQWRIELQPLGARYLAPVYVPLLCTAVCALDRLLSTRVRVRRHGLLVAAIALAGALWLAGGALLNARVIMQANAQGLGVAAAMYIYTNRYAAQLDNMIGQSELLIRDDFDVYRNENRLIFVPRQVEDGAAQFSEDVPIAGKPFTASLPSAVHRAGFTDRSLWQWERSSDAAVWTRIPRATRSSTYVYTPAADDVGYQLRAYVRYTDRRGNRVQAMTAPSLRVQAGGAGGLVFLLHVIPVDADDLPDHRRQDGFEILDFRFDDYELPLIESDSYRRGQTERSVALRQLPAYDIAAIRVGQYVLVAGGVKHIWEEEIRFPLEQ